MVQLLTWEWLARDIMFQLANGRFIGLPWRRSGRGCPGKPPGCKKGARLREEPRKNKMVVHLRKRVTENLWVMKGV